MGIEFVFDRLEFCILYDLLKDAEMAEALVFLATHQEHRNLQLKAKSHSIIIHNDDVHVAIVLLVGFQNDEFPSLRTFENVHLVSFRYIVREMWGFEHLPIKVIDKFAWLSTAIARSKHEAIQTLRSLSILNV